MSPDLVESEIDKNIRRNGQNIRKKESIVGTGGVRESNPKQGPALVEDSAGEGEWGWSWRPPGVGRSSSSQIASESGDSCVM